MAQEHNTSLSETADAPSQKCLSRPCRALLCRAPVYHVYTCRFSIDGQTLRRFHLSSRRWAICF